MRHLLALLVILGVGTTASVASASQIVSTRSVTALTLGVDGAGEAMVSYVSHGKTMHVLAFGATNGQTPVKTERPAALTLEYDGGYQKEYTNNPVASAALAKLRSLQSEMARATATGDNPARYALKPQIAAAFALLSSLRAHAANYYRTFACPTYTGPALAWQVAECTAPDGSYWAVQEWQRQLPDYGVSPTSAQAAMEVHLSHWTGALPKLTIGMNWAHKRFAHLFGTFTYAGSGVYGFASTPTGAPLDNWGRNLYIDTFDSSYGPGWSRENSFLTHKPAGSFCYGFYPHGVHPAGNGRMYRATIMGPGLTPDMMWEGALSVTYSPSAQAVADQAIVALDDPQCKQV